MMGSLVPGVLFYTPGLNRNSTPTPPKTTPQELDQLYARQDFDGRPWPFDSPVAGVYDVRNTSTKMIILNNKYGEGFTKLRGYCILKGERCIDPDRHFRENSPRNMSRHLRCYESSWALFPSEKVKSGQYDKRKVECPKPFVRHTKPGKEENPKEQEITAKKHVDDSEKTESEEAMIVSHSSDDEKTTELPLIVVASDSSLTPDTSLSVSYSSVSQGEYSHESSWELHQADENSDEFPEKADPGADTLTELECIYHKKEGVDRPISRLGRPVLTGQETDDTENVKQERDVDDEDELKSNQSDNPHHRHGVFEICHCSCL